MLTWHYHDDFRTEKDARVYGERIVKIGFARGVKIKKNLKKKKRRYELYILPLSSKKETE